MGNDRKVRPCAITRDQRRREPYLANRLSEIEDEAISSAAKQALTARHEPLLLAYLHVLTNPISPLLCSMLLRAQANDSCHAMSGAVRSD